MMPEEIALEQAAERLLDQLATEGARRLTLEPVLASTIDRWIRATVGKWRGTGALGIDAEDVVQEVYEKLLKCPPNRATEGAPPVRRLHAWINKTAINHLTSLRRKTRARPEYLSKAVDGSLPEATEKVTPERSLSGVQGLSAVRQVLLTHYPRGLALFELVLDNPDATTPELARALAIQPANLYQIRKRLHGALREHGDHLLVDASGGARR